MIVQHSDKNTKVIPRHSIIIEIECKPYEEGGWNGSEMQGVYLGNLQLTPCGQCRVTRKGGE
jgi:hypothetical protein